MPVERGCIAAHSSARAAGKYETGQWHGVDTKCVTPLIWIVVFLIENIVFRKGPGPVNHEN